MFATLNESFSIMFQLDCMICMFHFERFSLLFFFLYTWKHCNCVYSLDVNGMIF